MSDEDGFHEGEIVEIKYDDGGWILARIVRNFGGLSDRPTHYTIRFLEGPLGIFDAEHIRKIETHDEQL